MSEEDIPPDELDVYLNQRYELAEQAGEGGASTVHRAKRKADGRDVVIKVHTATADGALERFRREARLLAELKHPRIVRLLEVLELGDRPGLVMECVPGGSVRDQLERDRKLPAIRAVSLARDILEGLEVLHGHGVIHRDVKPENVLIGPDGRALLADLGVARPVEDEDSLTGKGCVVGTPRYMAPELLHSQEPTPAVDVYATGLVLHEMLTGQAGIDLDHFPKIVLFHHDGLRPPRLREIDPTLPESLDALVHELTEPDPAKRPESARAAIARLDAAVKAGISAAVPRPRPSRVVTALKKPPQPTRKIPALTQVPIEPPPRSRALWLLALLALAAVAGMALAYLRRPPVVPAPPKGLRATAVQGKVTAAGRLVVPGEPLAFGEELAGNALARLTLGVDDRELEVAFVEASAFTMSESPRGRRLVVRTGRVGLRSSGGLVELKSGGSAIVSAPTSH